MAFGMKPSVQVALKNCTQIITKSMTHTLFFYLFGNTLVCTKCTVFQLSKELGHIYDIILNGLRPLCRGIQYFRRSQIPAEELEFSKTNDKHNEVRTTLYKTTEVITL